MRNSKIEELKIKNRLSRLSKVLASINNDFHNCIIRCYTGDYQKLIAISEQFMIEDFRANGSKVADINCLLSSFKASIQKYLKKNGDDELLILIPYDNYYFEVEANLQMILTCFDKLISTFFIIDDNSSEEILIYKNNLSAGLCLFREEHSYYISTWRCQIQ